MKKLKNVLNYYIHIIYIQDIASPFYFHWNVFMHDTGICHNVSNLHLMLFLYIACLYMRVTYHINFSFVIKLALFFKQLNKKSTFILLKYYFWKQYVNTSICLFWMKTNKNWPTWLCFYYKNKLYTISFMNLDLSYNSGRIDINLLNLMHHLLMV